MEMEEPSEHQLLCICSMRQNKWQELIEGCCCHHMPTRQISVMPPQGLDSLRECHGAAAALLGPVTVPGVQENMQSLHIALAAPSAAAELPYPEDS